MLCNAFSRPCEISRSPIDSSSDWPQVCTILIIIIANNAIIGAEEREAREAPLTLPPALIRQCTKCGRRWHLSWRLGWLLRLGIKMMANSTAIVHFSALFNCIIYNFIFYPYAWIKGSSISNEGIIALLNNVNKVACGVVRNCKIWIHFTISLSLSQVRGD